MSEPAPAEFNSTPALANDSATDEMTLAALLAGLGLAAVGGVAYAAARRRRHGALEREDETAASLSEGSDEEAAPPSAPPPMRHLESATPRPSPAIAAPVVNSAAAPLRSHAHGDPVPLPAEVPESFEERDALLRELVAARPDRANPFTSPRARARRAKLIIQSLARDFTTRKPRIDLSEYTNRWPALRGWQPATA